MARLRLPLMACVFICATMFSAAATVATAQEKKEAQSVAEYLQDISVTVRSDNSSGSGVIVQTKDGQIWIWTAGHVAAQLRHSREVIDDNGSKRTKVEFKDAKIIRFNKNEKEGRIVSNYSGDAEIVRYSSAEFGHDLALLRLRDKSFKPAASAKFYLDEKLPPVGEDVRHCGSLLGVMGSNSITGGLISQHGRVFDGKIFDQTTATSFPGSSGGVVALKSDGRYVGMLVMGAGEGFGFIVPVRRMHSWAKKVGVEFAMDPTKPVPTDAVLFEKPVEDGSGDSGCAACKERTALGVKFMLYDEHDPLAKIGTLKDWFARPGLQFVPELEKK